MLLRVEVASALASGAPTVAATIDMVAHRDPDYRELPPVELLTTVSFVVGSLSR